MLAHNASGWPALVHKRSYPSFSTSVKLFRAILFDWACELKKQFSQKIGFILTN